MSSFQTSGHVSELLFMHIFLIHTSSRYSWKSFLGSGYWKCSTGECVRSRLTVDLSMRERERERYVCADAPM